MASIFDEKAANELDGADLGDVLARDLRVVTLDFWRGQSTEYIVHKDQVPALVEGSIKLHFDPGINPHNKRETSRIWRIRCAHFRAYGPYWWAQRELDVVPSEGAFTIRSGIGKTLWYDETYEEVA